MSTLTNVTIDEMEIGKKATFTKTCTEADIQLFATVSGDVNPVHLDAEYAAGTQFGQRIAHGMYSKARCLAQMQEQLPAAFAVNVEFKLPVYLPAKVAYYQQDEEQGWDFGMRSEDAGKPYLLGSIIKN